MPAHATPRMARPLARLPIGSRGRVEALSGGQGMVAQLAAMGLRAGSLVLVKGHAGGAGPVAVEADGVRLAIGWAVGALVSAGGVGLSFVLDLPTGAMIVATFGGALLLLALARWLLFRGMPRRTTA